MQKKYSLILWILLLTGLILPSPGVEAKGVDYGLLQIDEARPSSPYCMIYPKTGFRRDKASEANVGDRTFKATNGKSKIEITPRMRFYDSLRESYEQYLQDIREEYPGVSFTVNMLKPNYYVFSWANGDTIHYCKRWQKKNLDLLGVCFVYDKSEKELFDVIIRKVVSYNPGACLE